MPELNGTTSIVKAGWWALGIIGTILTSLTTGWVVTTNGQIRNHGERLPVIESKVEDVRQDMKGINGKLDKIIERQDKR